jgi:hypothetical protein
MYFSWVRTRTVCVQNRYLPTTTKPSGSGLESGNLDYGFGFVSGSESWKAKVIRQRCWLDSRHFLKINNGRYCKEVANTIFPAKNFFWKSRILTQWCESGSLLHWPPGSRYVSPTYVSRSLYYISIIRKKIRKMFNIL